MRVSNCCGADVYENTDICTDCKEHTTVLEPCKTCKGEGEIEVKIGRVAITRHTVAVESTKCTECDGEGYIEADI